MTFEMNVTDEKSKDGLAHDLFPLTRTSKGTTNFAYSTATLSKAARLTTSLSFRRTSRDTDWAGEAYIDAPWSSSRFMCLPSFHSPYRSASGNSWTDLPGIGFRGSLPAQDGGVWFPVSLGANSHRALLLFIARERCLWDKQGLRAHARAEQESRVASNIAHDLEDGRPHPSHGCARRTLRASIRPSRILSRHSFFIREGNHGDFA